MRYWTSKKVECKAKIYMVWLKGKFGWYFDIYIQILMNMLRVSLIVTVIVLLHKISTFIKFGKRHVGSAIKESISFKNVTQLHASGFLNVSDCNSLPFLSLKDHFSLRLPHLTSASLPFSFVFLPLQLLSSPLFSQSWLFFTSLLCSWKQFSLSLQLQRSLWKRPNCTCSMQEPSPQPAWLFGNAFFCASILSHCLKKYANATAVPVAKPVTD